MIDWNDIKKAFDKDNKTPKELEFERERRFLASIAEYLSSQKGMSSVKGYLPEEVITFMEKSPAEIKSILGGEWAQMEDSGLELLIYSMIKKVKKSENLLEWK